MMNNEDRLQERLEQLENGAPLSKCLAGLPEEEKEMIRLAAALSDVPVPVQASQAVASQRDNLVTLAKPTMVNIPASTSAVPAARFSFRKAWSGVRLWWRRQTAFEYAIAAGVAPALIILVIGLVAGLISGPQTMILEEAGPGDGTESVLDQPGSRSETVVSEEGAPSQTLAIAPEATGVEAAFETFVPITSMPLALDAETAAVQDVRGVVQLQDENGNWQPIAGPGALKAGQRVRTGKLSSATLLYHDGSLAKLGPDTELSLDSLDAQKAEDGVRTVVMTQWIGESDHHVAFRNDAGSRYEVKTPNGSGVARGTTFHVLVTEDELAQFSVDEGAVAVTNEDKTVLVQARQITTVSADEVPEDPAFYVTGQGEVTAMGDFWTIGGQVFGVNGDTVIVGDPQLGDTVLVIGHVNADTTLVADQIFLVERAGTDDFTIVGEVESQGSDNWVIAGQTIWISNTTEIDNGINLGDLVRAQGIVRDDDSLLAHRITLVDDSEGLEPFEFTGVVELIGDPLWTISGATISVDGQTEIKGDPAVGDLVHVEGRILADGTWLAEEIELLDDEDEIMVEIIGNVDSIDPWVVSGYPFVVDGNTLIDEGIVLGSLVKVKALVQQDGSWLATEIELLDDDDVGEGCFTITAEVLAFTGDELVINGWPDLSLGDDVDIDGEVKTGAIVVITICMNEQGELVVRSILVISGTLPPDPEDSGEGQTKVTVCHKPDKKGGHEITIAQPAVPAHLAHGDYLGACNDAPIDNPPGPPDQPGPPANNGNGKPPKPAEGNEGNVTLCHKPDGNNGGKTMTVNASAASAHFGHGDTRGACGD